MQNPILFAPTQPVRSYYLHWPFCPYRCHFCPFIALAGQDDFMQPYHEALRQEIIEYFGGLPEKPQVSTIFMGGGTPSTYPAPILLDTFGILRDVANIDQDAEISLEVNPGTVNLDLLATWRQAGINRMSVGVQSLDDAVLARLNRHQKARDVFWLMEVAPDYIDNISIDLIVGLPGVSQAAWEALIETVVRWPIKHLSLYFLTVHEDTQLYFGVKKKSVSLPPDDQVVDMWMASRAVLELHGFMQYEISNFARPGFQSRHNSAYWARVPYKAFGLGACSFDGTSRFQNEKNLTAYLARVREKQVPYVCLETLDADTVWLETMMLGLRQLRGVSRRALLSGLPPVREKAVAECLDRLCDDGLLKNDGDQLSLTIRGLALENEIILTLSRTYDRAVAQ